MRYWLTCDGGGTKLIALLVDEDMNVVSQGLSGGVNPNFIPRENIARHMDECLRAVRAGYEDIQPEVCYISMPCPAIFMEEALSRAGLQVRVVSVNEGRMGLVAGICAKEGFAALSGTGSDVFYEGPAGTRAIGGWGLMLGDEGSGGQIGQKGIIAAIHSFEGRGRYTSLTKHLMGWLGWDEDSEPLRFLRERLCPRVYEAPSPRAVLASFAPYVTEAHREGDHVAGMVLAEAGMEMGRQMTALIASVTKDDPSAIILPSTICGGSWKGSRTFYRAYRKHVLEAYPGFEIIWPKYEAVTGGAVLGAFEMGYASAEISARMAETFSKYTYPTELTGS
jgi:N-acetylglucosamine kinase-like BadF-type ATPase